MQRKRQGEADSGDSEHARIDRYRGWIVAILSVLITYGSLYPFEFSVPPSQSAALAELFSDLTVWTSIGDVTGNIALFVPLGWAATLAANAAHGQRMRMANALLQAFGLALALQVAQIYVPGRSAALADVVWNMAGMVAGIAVGTLLSARRAGLPRVKSEQALPLCMIALWIAAELLPFIPSIDLQLLKDSIKTLLAPVLDAQRLAFHFGGALIAGRALAALVSEAASRGWLLRLVIAIAAIKAFILGGGFNFSTVGGLALGCATWWLVARWPEPRRAAAVVSLLIAGYAVTAIMPFEIRYYGAPFNWVPFGGSLEGSMLHNTKALLSSLCFFVGILGTVRMNGVSAVPTSFALALLVGMLEAAQMFLEGRSPGITEPILVLLTGQALRMQPRSARG